MSSSAQPTGGLSTDTGWASFLSFIADLSDQIIAINRPANTK